MDGRQTPLYELQRKLEEVQRNSNTYVESSYWKHLQENVGKMSSDQIQWTMSQPDVEARYSEMQQAFTNYLFEKYKDDFASIPSFKPFADAYVDAVLTTSTRYIDRATRLEQELEDTRKQLEELKNATRP